MNVNKPLGHTNYTTTLLRLDFKFDSTLMLLELMLKNGIARTLGGITKGEALS
jgi:hypothetical protein